MNTLTTSILRLTFLGALIALALGINYVMAWTGPTQAAPGGNTSAPVNTGTTLQAKAGAFQVGGSLDVAASSTVRGGISFLPNATLVAPRYTIDLDPLPVAASNAIRFADGTVQATATVASQGLSFNDYIHLQHTISADYAIGTGWRVRPLNVVVTNTIEGASLASNRITLPAGTYYIQGDAHGYSVDFLQSAIYDETNARYLFYGLIGKGNGGGQDNGGDSSEVSGMATFSSGVSITLRFYAWEGGGCQANIPTTVCSDVKIWKLN